MTADRQILTIHYETRGDPNFSRGEAAIGATQCLAAVIQGYRIGIDSEEAAMSKKTKTWAQKMQTPPPHVEVTEKAFAGIPAGSRLVISSPVEIDAWLRNTKPGDLPTVAELRAALARRHKVDAACPMTTGIFLRIVAEAAWDQLEAGAGLDAVTPFWRAVDPKSPLAKKLRAGPDWIAAQRSAEAGARTA